MNWNNFNALAKKYPKIPLYILESFLFYRDQGRDLGQFGEAVISDNLREAFRRADDDCIKAMDEIMTMLENDFPAGSHGSFRMYQQWRDIGGLVGMMSSSQ